MSDREINLTVVDAPVKLMVGQPPYAPLEFLMAGYNEDGEFFCVSSLDDVQIAWVLDTVFKLLRHRLNGNAPG